MIFPKLKQVFPSKTIFNDYCETLGMETIDDNLYAHLMIEYGDSTLRYASLEVGAAKVISIMALQYPIYLQKKVALEALHALELKDFGESAISISNVAQNPNNTPIEEVLPYVSAQQTMKTKLSKLDSIVSMHRATLQEYTKTLLKELAPLFRGIHKEREDIFIYEAKYEN